MHIKVNYFRRSGVKRELREFNVCEKFGCSTVALLTLLHLPPLLAALIELISVCLSVCGVGKHIPNKQRMWQRRRCHCRCRCSAVSVAVAVAVCH